MSFSEATLLKKIQDVNNTQQSIQTLSFWLIHHRKYSKQIVQTWLQQLLAASNCDRKITFIYLSNDILQNSRKKGSEFLKEFLNVLPQAIENTSRVADTKSRFTLERIFNIWKDRRIYNDETIKKFRDVLHSQPKLNETSSPTSKITVAPLLKTGVEVGKKPNEVVKVSPRKDDDKKRKNNGIEENAIEAGSKIFKKNLRDEVLKELAVSDIKVPEPFELVAKLQELEKSASSDAIIRERIAELPSQVHDVNAVKNLKDRKVALELLASVNDAAKLVDDYNSRLQQELINRKQTSLLFSESFLLLKNYAL